MIPDPKKILLVDRSAGADRLRATLLGSGYPVVVAGSRAEAIDVLRNGFRPQAIVLGDNAEVRWRKRSTPYRRRVHQFRCCC